MQSTVEEKVQAAEELTTEVAAEVLSGTKRPAPGAPENRPAQGPSQVAKPRTEATEVAAEVMSGTKRPAPGAPENRLAQGPSQVAKPRTLPACSRNIAQQPQLAQLPAAPMMGGDRSKESLHTPRVSLLPAPEELFVWKPVRVGADAALAGPNGIQKACNLRSEEFIIATCSVHIQRAATQNKHKAHPPNPNPNSNPNPGPNPYPNPNPSPNPHPQPHPHPPTQAFADPENVSKMNADMERHRVSAITPELSSEGKKLLKRKYEYVDPSGAAYFGQQCESHQFTYADVNRKLPNESADMVDGGVPTTANGIERQNLAQKQVQQDSEHARPHTCPRASTQPTHTLTSQVKEHKRVALTQHLAEAFESLEQTSMGDLSFNGAMPRGEPSTPLLFAPCMGSLRTAVH